MKKTILLIATAIIIASAAASVSAKKRTSPRTSSRTSSRTRPAAAAPARTAPPAEAVDLGLSVKWAPRNLGARSATDPGTYYAWGEISPKKIYSEDSCRTFGVNFQHRSIAGDTLMDAATKAWGKGWRLPTEDEIIALTDSCRWDLATQNGTKGYKVTGPSGSSIFLPLAGFYTGEVKLDDGENLYYWSSMPVSTRLAVTMSVQTGTPQPFTMPRNIGLPIRPVRD